jgi:exodeoxyribonuclease VII small subunit
MSAEASPAPQAFDEALKELRGIVSELQKPDVSIDWLTTAVQRATVLLAYCNKHLNATEQEVSDLIRELGIDSESSSEK